jgi:hypothetical protein
MEGPTPLGAQMGSSAWAPAPKYCHNGGMALAHNHARLAGEGSAIGIMAPVVLLRKQPVCRGKSVPLGSNGLVCLSANDGREPHGDRGSLRIAVLGTDLRTGLLPRLIACTDARRSGPR